MAPISTTEEISAHKRKRDIDEKDKRKRARRDHLASHNIPIHEQASPKANGLLKISENPDKMTSATKEPTFQVVKKENRRQRRSHEKQTTWGVSKPMGGMMLNVDPILADDEMHLILAFNTSIQVYSATESLLIRKIPLLKLNAEVAGEQIISTRLSPTSPNIIWVASSAGRLWAIDWTNGTRNGAICKLECGLLCGMSVERVQFKKGFQDIVLTSIEHRGRWQIVACDVRDSKLKSFKSLLTQSKPVLNLSFVRSGYAIAGSADRNILLGILRNSTIKGFQDLEYEFFTLDCSDEIVCLDVRATNRVHLNLKSQAEAGDEPVVEIAVGCARGAIYFYNDLLPRLRSLQNGKGHKNSLQPRKYHWHRKAVHDIKWSRDGNYLISGGSESTLVLWQLDTQKMDFLPHLSATIENIVISKNGSAYVLHLDDNSVIVLSTADMKPTTYISGLQTLLFPQSFSKDDLVRRVGQYVPSRLLKTPATVSPADPSRIHFCVGNGQQMGHSGSGPSTPMIQTLDLTTLQSISKQALTRTNPTDINVTTKGYAITEPRITGMAYSADGKWLATIDEWQPPTRDVNSLEGSPAERREVYLKFWATSSEDQSLELVSRINAPHFTGRSEPVYGLAADPHSHRFATVGQDGVVRLWEPTIRQRDGVLVRGKLGRQLHNWACSRTIYLQENEELVDPNVVASKTYLRGSGAVCFSEDGSTLVCAIGTVHGSILHVIDTESGKIRNSLDGLIHGEVRDVRVLSSCLVVLSDRLIVYDLVSDELLYGVQLRISEDHHGPGPSILTHMAVDHRTSSFAVAVTRGKLDSPNLVSELAVFTPDQSEPAMVRKFPHPVTSVVASVGSSGYLVLDSAAQLWSVTEGMDTNSLAFAQPLADLNLEHADVEDPREAQPLALLAGPDDEPGSGDEMDVDVPDVANDDEDNAYPAVVPPQKLATLFDSAPAFAMPPIEDMFYQVTKLLSSSTTVSSS